jgi:methionine-rich copper-binding protein CopC
VMVRRLVIVSAASLAVAIALPTGAIASSSRVHATLTRAIPPNMSSGNRVVVAWKLRDASGHPVAAKRVFVKITCPEGTDSTTAFANAGPNGTYLAHALVPPGGIGTVSIGHGKLTYPVTNPFHR